MPVFPAVASMTVPPGFSLPSRSARAIRPIAARSFTLPPGFRYSSLAKMSAAPGGASLFMCSMGVSPTSLEMSSLTRRREFTVVIGTLQSKERKEKASMRGISNSQVVIPSAAKDLLFAGARESRSFASLRMTTRSSPLLPSRNGLAPSVISAFRADGEFAVAMGTGIHLHLTVATLVLRRRRFVSNGVLGANIVSHGTADGINFVQRLREESEAAGSLRHDLQSASGVLRVLFLLQYADGVDGGSAVDLQTPHCLLQSLGALVVLSVRHHKNNFLFELGVLFQVVGGSDDRIVERRAASRLDLLQPLFQLIDVGGEILVEVVLVVEVDDEHFVVGV